MFDSKSRRKASNIIIDPQALLRFSIPFIALVIISVGTIMVIHWEVLSALSNIESLSNFNPATSVSVSQAIGKITMVGMIGMFLLGILCLAMWIIYSHRIFGPTVPIRRHIVSLLGGNYESRVTLRKRDEFKDIAMDLNKLAEKLAAQKT
ncbi:MAG: hypothetical protein ACXVA9_11445 [Bdellovibrionales bacterium]